LNGSENEDVIGFESGHVGELRVSGRLHEAAEAQQLDFNFVAEWEGLSSFIDGLRQLRAGDAK
jgi:hypothetical protein